MTGELDETRPPRAVAGSPAVPGGTANVRDGRRWLILAVIGLAQLMVVLDATIVNIALPSAQRALGFSTADRQWVVTAYALAFGGLLLVGGRLSDLLGRKRTFIAGLAGFAVASAVGGAAPGFADPRRGAGGAGRVRRAARTVGARAAHHDLHRPPRARQGAGHLHRHRRRGRGHRPAARRGADRVPVVAVVPLRQRRFAVIAAGGAVTLISGQRQSRASGLDVPGSVLAVGGLAAIVYGFSEASTSGWGSGLTIGPLAGGVAVARRLRPRGAPGRPPAAAAARGGRPGPRCRLSRRGHRHLRHHRHVPAAHLLPPAGPGVHAGGGRAGVPALHRGHHGRLRRGEQPGTRALRSQGGGPRRPAAGRGGSRLADQDRPARQLRVRRRARAGPPRPGGGLRRRDRLQPRPGRHPARRHRSGGRHGEHQQPGRRLARRRPAQHDRGHRGRVLPGQPPSAAKTRGRRRARGRHGLHVPRRAVRGRGHHHRPAPPVQGGRPGQATSTWRSR